MDAFVIVFTCLRCAIFALMETLCFVSQMRGGWTWTVDDNKLLIALIFIYFAFRILFFVCTKVPLKIRTQVQHVTTIVFTSIEGGASCLFLFIVMLPWVAQKPWLLIALNVYMLLISVFSFCQGYRKTQV